MKLAEFAHKLQHIANIGKSQENIIFIDEKNNEYEYIACEFSENTIKIRIIKK